MNRLVSAPRRRFFSTQPLVCGAALWLLAPLISSAQVSAPQSRSAEFSQPLTRLADSQRSVAASATTSVDALLVQTKSALDRKDYHAAVQAFRKASAAANKTAPQIAGLQQLHQRFAVIGIDTALLTMPPQESTNSVQRLPSIAGAKPIAGAASGLSVKQQALRLVALGRAALDRGEVASALSLARAAEALKVPEKEFAAGETRPWQLVLDAESAARRSGVALASASQGNLERAVQPAIAASAAGDAGGVQQMLFLADASDGQTNSNSANSNSANSSPTNANHIQQVQNIQPLPPGQGGVQSYGEQLFYAGLDALTRGDKEKAREQFKAAWKHEADLNPSQRNQLKDKLTLLQAKRLGSAAEKPADQLTPIQKASLEAEQQTRRLFREVTSELAKAEESKTSNPLRALDQLNRLSRRVNDSNIDEPAKHSLSKMVERAITDQKQYVEANRAKIDLDLRNEAIRSERESDQARDLQIDEEVKTLVDSFNKYMNERRFAEAEVVAKQVIELRPDHPIAGQLNHISRTKSSIATYEETQGLKQVDFLRQMNDVDRSSVGIDPDRPLTFGDERDWASISQLRAGYKEDRYSNLSEAERKIKQKLNTPVSIKYSNRPLNDVLNDLAAMTGVPIVVDHRALSSVRVTAETPISIRQLNNIRLESALNLILEQLELTYVIDNDVLEITSMESKRSRVYPRTYPVKDLVIPIPNFFSSYDDGLAGALRAAIQMTGPQVDVQVMPVSATDLGSRMSKSMSPTYMGNDVMGQYHQMGSQGGFGNPSSIGGAAGGGSVADFDSLIELIETTVAPETWESLGGPSNMQPYAQNLSLVISTTSEVHDQIVELLESLRRLQNLQITIEVRFITLADSFAEQIGVDFNVQFDDNITALPADDSGSAVTIGFDGIAGLPTPDLDIRFENGSFGLTPPFGAAALGTPSTIGFAILNDIEAFFFLQAAQADNRSNIMQAPKVTMFDGQFANIADITQRPFVTSIIPVVGDFAVAQQPVIVVLNEGTQLNVQGIVSDDKRFVRLTLVPYFSQIGDVNTFTYEGRRTTRNSSRAQTDTDGDGDIDENDVVEESDQEDVIEGTTVQLPTFASTSVQTTVSVPDGGTILLGGIKRMAEGRVERGVPMLSKIPYVNRLFRNVSAGRDARSLMLMVTPRIIIQEEEELAQTGFNPNER